MAARPRTWLTLWILLQACGGPAPQTESVCDDASIEARCDDGLDEDGDGDGFNADCWGSGCQTAARAVAGAVHYTDHNLLPAR